jgi:DnaJ-class molecular chaperone
LKQALLGTLLVIPYLDSAKAPYQLRTYRDILAPQTEKRFINQGLPYPKDPTRYGDLIVKFEILFPKLLNEEQRTLIENCFSNSIDFYQSHNSPLHTTIIDPIETQANVSSSPTSSVKSQSTSNTSHTHRHANGHAGQKSPVSTSQANNPTSSPIKSDIHGTVF